MTTTSHDVRRLRWVVVVVLLAGCAQPGASDAGRHRHRQHARAHSAPTSSPANLPVHARTARAELDRLAVRPRPRGTEGYVRDAFGSAWLDTDDNGCNQRDDVLLRDAVPGTPRVRQQGSCDHDVLAGSWHDPYTGRTLSFTDLKDLSQAQAIQIDLVVPLAEAWVSGARRWSRERRETFANDLAGLLAVDGPTNISKSDDDPAAWRPRKSYQCTYARRWIAVKFRYHLAVDTAEKAALDQMLDYCR